MHVSAYFIHDTRLPRDTLRLDSMIDVFHRQYQTRLGLQAAPKQCALRDASAVISAPQQMNATLRNNSELVQIMCTQTNITTSAAGNLLD